MRFERFAFALAGLLTLALSAGAQQRGSPDYVGPNTGEAASSNHFVNNANLAPGILIPGNQPGSCPATTLTWTVAGVTCDGAAVATANGQTATVNDSTSPTVGNATYACSSGTFSIQGTPACTNTGANCPAQPVNWTANGLTCDGNTTAVTNGQTTPVVNDATAPTLGSARFVCNSGSLTVAAGATCNQNCFAGTSVAWTVGANTCNGILPTDLTNGQTSPTITDSAAPATGSSTFTCNNGALSQNAGATCVTSGANCPAGTAVTWTVGGNSCNGTLPATVNNGANSAAVTDSTAPTTGSSTFACSNGTVSQNAGATCTTSATGCAAQTLSWSVSSVPCSGNAPATNIGANAAVSSANGNPGSASFACNAGGTFAATPQAGATCAPGSCSGAVTWTVGGNTCTGTLAGTVANGSISPAVTDSTAPTTGSSTFTCTNGTATQNAGATCNAATPCSGAVTWTVGANTCNGSLTGSVASGATSSPVTDSTAPSTGTASFTCNNGTSTPVAGATCNAPSPNCLAGNPVMWNSEFDAGDTCSSSLPATINNGATSTAPAYDIDFSAASGTAGFSTFSCSNGVVTARPGRRCGRPPKQVTDLSVSGRNACIIQSDRTVKCTGFNFFGQIGNGTTTENTRFGVTQFTDVDSISLSQTNACAITTGGRILCAGSDRAGGFGRGSGSLTNSNVIDVTASHPPGGYRKISMGGFHSCGIQNSGQLYCWGVNTFGEMGIGSADGASSQARGPMPVPGMTNVIDVAAAAGSCPNGEITCDAVNNGALGRFTCAVTSAGQVFCWGKNDGGQLGNGNTTNQTSPTLISSISGATQVTVGLGHGCARLNTGVLRCWGNNLAGQLGDNTQTTRRTPVAVNGISTATEVKAHSYSTCALLADGTGRCWGNNAVGEVGNGGPVNNRHGIPQVLSNAAGAATGLTKIEVGINNVCARVSSGTVTCWGRKDFGEIADGSPVSNGTPSGRNFPFFGFEQ